MKEKLRNMSSHRDSKTISLIDFPEEKNSKIKFPRGKKTSFKSVKAYHMTSSTNGEKTSIVARLQEQKDIL